MDLSLSAEQTLLRDMVRTYCQRNHQFPDRLQTLHGVDGFSRDHWKAYAELGWLGVTMPEALGGAGASFVEAAIILEEFGRFLVLEPFVPCIVLAAHALYAAATAEQRSRVLPAVIRGEVMLALAHSEAEARGDVRFVETRAHRRAGGAYVLSGSKSLVLGGSSADLLIVSARTCGAGRDCDGVSLFLLRPDLPGVTQRSFRTVDGGSASSLVLRDVEMTAETLLGEEGAASAALADAFDHAIVGLCAEAVGAMETVVTVTRDYLKTRRAYGTTLSTFQALQHRLADMLIELELSRSMLYRALAGLGSPDAGVRRTEVSAAKALIGRSGRFVGGNGVQLHGGLGMSDDYIVGHLFKRLTVIEALFGNSDYHLQQVLAAGARPEVHHVALSEVGA